MALFGLCLLALTPILGVTAVDVETNYGTVRGSTVPVFNGIEDSQVDVFLGIPFAASTAGPNRFRKPVEPPPFEDVFIADTKGPQCPSFGAAISTDGMGEDCLTLNIYSPNVTGGPYAVMFWVFGGGFQGGSSEVYNGHFLASHDVVLVALNHRTNILGFASTGNDQCPGNFGLWDQHRALEYVRDNIAAFGGDNQRVTIFGQSSGGVSAAFAVLSPTTQDLIHGAILQSGTETSIGTIIDPDASGEYEIRLVADQLDCGLPDDADMLDCLRELPFDVIYRNASWNPFGFSGVVDGEGGYLPRHPVELREQGDIMTGPVMAGFTRDDASIHVTMLVPEAALGCCNRTYFLAVMQSRLVEFFTNPSSNSSLEKIYKAFDYAYTPWPYVYDNERNRGAFVRMFTDMLFHIEADKVLKSQQALSPTYGYVYDYRSPNDMTPEWFGVMHGGELAFLFGFTLYPFNPHIENTTATDWVQEDIDQTIFLQTLFTNFAKYGNPTPEPVDNPLGGTTSWSQYTADDPASLHISNSSIGMEQYRPEFVALMEEYVPYLEGATRKIFKDESEIRPFAEIYTDLMSVIGRTEDTSFLVFDDVDFDYGDATLREMMADF